MPSEDVLRDLSGNRSLSDRGVLVYVHPPSQDIVWRGIVQRAGGGLYGPA